MAWPLRTMRTIAAIPSAASTSQPTIASDDGLLPGVVDIDGPRTRSARRTQWRETAPGGDQSQPGTAVPDGGSDGFHHSGRELAWGRGAGSGSGASVRQVYGGFVR